MADVDLYVVQNFVYLRKNEIELVEAAASVANAIHAGLGPMIKGTMMEDQLRKALGLKPGQLVNIPKPNSTETK